MEQQKDAERLEQYQPAYHQPNQSVVPESEKESVPPMKAKPIEIKAKETPSLKRLYKSAVTLIPSPNCLADRPQSPQFKFSQRKTLKKMPRNRLDQSTMFPKQLEAKTSNLFQLRPSFPKRQTYTELQLFQSMVKMIDYSTVLTFQQQIKSFSKNQKFFLEAIKVILTDLKRNRSKRSKRLFINVENGEAKVILANDQTKNGNQSLQNVIYSTEKRMPLSSPKRRAKTGSVTLLKQQKLRRTLNIKFPTDYTKESMKFQIVRNPLKQALLFLNDFKNKRQVNK